MGKLATTGRLVTRDNEEEEGSARRWKRSGASSGRALVAVPNRSENDSTGESRREDRGIGSEEKKKRKEDREYSGYSIVDTGTGELGGCGAVQRLDCPVGRGWRRRWWWWWWWWRSWWWLLFDDIVEETRDRRYDLRIFDEWHRRRRRCPRGASCRDRRRRCSRRRRRRRRRGCHGRGGGATCRESSERRTIGEEGSKGKEDSEEDEDSEEESEEDLGGWRRKEEESLGFGGVVGIATMVAAVATATAVAVALCVPAASAVPMFSRENPLSRTGPRHDLDRSTGLEDVYEDAFREEDRPTSGTVLNETELDIIRRSIARSLGLKRIPDPSKANVSQAEYERAHREYLTRMQRSFAEQTFFHGEKKLYVFPATAYPGNESNQQAETAEIAEIGQREKPYRHALFFPVEIPQEDIGRTTVDHATLRLLLHGPTTDRYNHRYADQLDLLLYVRMPVRRSRKLIDRRRIRTEDWRNSRWLELDATLAVSSWLEARLENLGLEFEILLNGEEPVRRTFSSPVLNVFTTSGSSSPASDRIKRSSPEQFMSLHKGRRTKCKGESKKCCRHELTVMFKDLKGFEFIVSPKTFDAGYCKGRCPPRYNPAHHHALLQSLLWKEDRKKVPKPCCAPSKLDQLMIVYFDENDSTQLKVSYWKDIQVLECACS